MISFHLFHITEVNQSETTDKYCLTDDIVLILKLKNIYETSKILIQTILFQNKEMK